MAMNYVDPFEDEALCSSMQPHVGRSVGKYHDWKIQFTVSLFDSSVLISDLSSIDTFTILVSDKKRDPVSRI